jgi:hypothetical protein
LGTATAVVPNISQTTIFMKWKVEEICERLCIEMGNPLAISRPYNYSFHLVGRKVEKVG